MELFGSAEAALDDVAAGVALGIEAGAVLEIEGGWVCVWEPLALRRVIWSLRCGLVNAILRAGLAARVDGWE